MPINKPTDTCLEVWCQRLFQNLHYSTSSESRAAAVLACLDFGRLIQNSIIPLAGSSAKVERFQELADLLIDVGRPWSEQRFTDENFPKTDSLQLLLDKFESVEITLQRLLNAQHLKARRQRRKITSLEVAA
jgi:hypothetical protein